MKKITLKRIQFHFAKKNILKMPDEEYIKYQYKDVFGKEINLENPQTFNEKLQWLKLNDRKDIYTKMADKYEVKEYVANIIGEEHIIPTLGIYNKFEEINFDKLPNQFVIKCTHDSGSVIICRDKNKINKRKWRKEINKNLKNKFFYIAREWCYKNIKPRIIIEEYMEDKKNEEMTDYKFYCFNGVPKYLYVSKGLENHMTAKISFFDENYNFAKFKRTDYKGFEEKPEKPHQFEEMKELSKKLAKGIPFVRVDFYEVNGIIYFSEFTFFPCGGYMPFDPIEYDSILGDLIELPSAKNIGGSNDKR